MAGAVGVRGGAPSDATLLRLYVDLANKYDDLCAAFPVSVSPQELDTGQIAEVERWHRLVRALAMRKFIVGGSDAVRVDHVIGALRRCLVMELPDVDQWEAEFKELRGARHAHFVATFEDILYGEFLHGEYDRHRRNLDRTQLSKDRAVWHIGQAAEFVVRKLRSGILVAARDGLLDDEATRVMTE